MKLVVVDAWVEHSNLVANLWFKQDDGEVVAFQHERPVKMWERLLDEEALVGLYSLELAMFYGEVFYE